MSMLVEENGVELARAPAPGARRRGRLRSLLLVGVALLLSAAMGLTNSAPANAWLPAVVPVVKGVAGIVATTVAGEVVMTKVDEAAGDGSAKGKWGKRLKGLPGLAAGLLGGMVGWMGLDDMIDGVKAPDDFATDVQSSESPGAFTGVYVNLTIEGVSWGHTAVSDLSNVPFTTFQIDASCVASRSDYASFCPGSSVGSLPGTYTGYKAETVCYNSTTDTFWTHAPRLRVNSPQSNAGYMLCNRNAGMTVQDQIFSVEVLRDTTQGYRGMPNPGVFYNPDFVRGDGTSGVTVTATGECRNPDTGDMVTVSKVVQGTEVIPTVQCPQGTVPQSIGWTSNVGGVTEDLGGVSTDWTPFPACAGFKCEKLITIDDVPCRVGIEACYDWQRVDPGRVKCEYGPYALGLPECSDLQHMYKTGWGVTQDPAKDPQRQPGWLPSNPDGTVDWTRVGTGDYRPDDVPNPEYKPPVRWTPENPPVTNPTPTPTATPPSGPPTSGPNPPVTNNPPDLDTEGKNCIAAAWSYNPVDWVFVPVKCALTWAFVPKPAAAAAINTNATNAITGTGLSDWMGVPSSLRSTIPSEGGCRGPELALPDSMGGGTYYPINACEHPLSRAAEMSRAISSLVIGVAGAYSILNSLSLALTGYRLIEPTTKDVDR